jgi:hypothetical protein
MLFLVVTQFYNFNGFVSKMLYLVLMGVFLTMLATVPFNMYRIRRKTEKKVRNCFTISLISFAILTIDFPTVLTIPRFYSVTNLANVFLILLLILFGALVVGLASIFVGVAFSLKEDKLEKKAKTTANVTPSHDEIRFSILTILYKKAEKTPSNATVSREQLGEILGVEDNKIDFNLEYLERKKLIDRPQLFQGSSKLSARITADGIDVIEHKEENQKQFPFISATIPIQIQNKFGLINIG